MVAAIPVPEQRPLHASEGEPRAAAPAALLRVKVVLLRVRLRVGRGGHGVRVGVGVGCHQRRHASFGCNRSGRNGGGGGGGGGGGARREGAEWRGRVGVGEVGVGGEQRWDDLPWQPRPCCGCCCRRGPAPLTRSRPASLLPSPRTTRSASLASRSGRTGCGGGREAGRQARRRATGRARAACRHAHRHFCWAEIDTEIDSELRPELRPKLRPRFGARVDVGAATDALGYTHLRAVQGRQLWAEPLLPP